MTCWKNWVRFVQPLGVDSYLQDTPYRQRVRCLSAFAACVRTGHYGRGKQVQTGTVSGALTAVGQTIALAYKVNPTKAKGSEKLVPRLQQALDGWRKVDPPTLKKLPVEADVPEFLADLGRAPQAHLRW